MEETSSTLQSVAKSKLLLAPDRKIHFNPQDAHHESYQKVVGFSNTTRCAVYGLQNRAVQSMLDFDYMSKREKPSVAAMIFPFRANHFL